MVNLLLTGAGYQIEYEETRAMNASSRFYTVVPPTEVKKGDIALWIDILPLTGGNRRLFHTGIVMEFNAATGQGKFLVLRPLTDLRKRSLAGTRLHTTGLFQQSF